MNKYCLLYQKVEKSYGGICDSIIIIGFGTSSDQYGSLLFMNIV